LGADNGVNLAPRAQGALRDDADAQIRADDELPEEALARAQQSG
jgi:hypothetical protein